jgi:hypothetical protein
MKNITVAVSDDTYRQARIWAAKNDTSVSAVVQDLLQNLPGLARVASAFTAGLPASATPLPPTDHPSFSTRETVKAILTHAISNSSQSDRHRNTHSVNL